MTDRMYEFDIVLNQLREAMAAVGQSPAAQIEIRAQFDEVVAQKNRYVFAQLEQRQGVLDGLNATLAKAIATIEFHIANFPLQTLREVYGRNSGAQVLSPAPVRTEQVPKSMTEAVRTHSLLKRVEISPLDLDALCRVAHSEVGHFAKYGPSQLQGGLAAVVDTIINRVAHDKFPDSIQFVVNQPYQFSAINTLGSWELLPAATRQTVDIVSEHCRRRSDGNPSSIGGATHFLNPFLSSPTAMASWGKYVVDNPVGVFGNVGKKDVHYHGYAPNVKEPADYVLAHNGAEFAFRGNGQLLTVREAGSFRSRLVSKCLAEWKYFGEGSQTEDADPHFRRVGAYWSTLGIPYDGQTKILNEATGKYSNPAWSSAFICYVLKQAGANSGFMLAQAHCHYVQDFISGRANALYAAEHPDHYSPQPGDLVHLGREGAANYSFSEARAKYLADSFYPSHSDVVIEIDRAGATLKTIGGNVGQSVGQKTFDIDQNGRLLPRREGKQKLPWIAVLRLLAQ